MKKEHIELLMADEGHLTTIQTILREAPSYSINVNGVAKVNDSAKELFDNLPPGCNVKQRYVFLILKEKEEVGVIAFIDGYPQKEIGYIGLFLFKESQQKKGLGRQALVLIEDFAKSLNLSSIELGVVESNPVEGFWQKMGYKRNGRSKPYQGEKVQSVVWVLSKKIL